MLTKSAEHHRPDCGGNDGVSHARGLPQQVRGFVGAQTTLHGVHEMRTRTNIMMII